MNENSLISVIIPVYNVEDYLEKCINSVIEQDYTNLEIFLIDDGSTDRSGTICDEYAQKDSRIKVIHQENAGQSAARNTALKLAEGDYYTFIDSDDFWDKDCLSFLLKLIKENDAQLAISAVRHLGFPEQIDKEVYNDKIYVCEGHDIASNILQGTNGFTAAAHHSLFDGKLCKEHSFIEGVIFEDLEFMINYSFDIKKAVTSKLRKYNYIYRKNNSSSAATLKRKEDLDYVISKIKKILTIKAPELLTDLDNRQISNYIALIRSMHKGEDKVFSIVRESILKIKIEKTMQTKSNFILYSSLKLGKIPFYLMNCIYNTFRKIRYNMKQGIKNGK